MPDGAGGFTEAWVALGTLWAEVMPGAGRDVAGEEVTLSSVPYRITVRAAPVGRAVAPAAGAAVSRRRAAVSHHRGDRARPGGRYLTCFAREEVPA